MNVKDHHHIIMVADDDEEFRLLVRSALEPSNYVVVEAETGDTALKKFRALQPNLVLLDVMMPELSGFDVCKEIRQSPNGLNTPIVMVTSLDDVESIQKAYRLGATDFITKPVDWQMLVMRVNFLLRAHQKIMHSIQIAIDAATNPDVQSKSGTNHLTLSHIESQLGPNLLKEFLDVIDDSIKELQIQDFEPQSSKASKKKNNDDGLDLTHMLHVHVQEMQSGVDFIQPYLTNLYADLMDIQTQLQMAVDSQNLLLWIQTLLRLKPHCEYTGYKPLNGIIESELITNTDNLLQSMTQVYQTVNAEIDQFKTLLMNEISENE